MGRPRRFNSYDNDVVNARKAVEQAGVARQDKAGMRSVFRDSPQGIPQGQGGSNRDDTRLSTDFGGSLKGPLAFTAETAAIDTGDLDITMTSAGTQKQPRSTIFIATESGTTDTLDTITGRIYEGQILVLMGISGNTITITHNNGGAGSILCPDDTDFTLSDDESIILQDDVTAATQTWRIIGGSQVGSSGSSVLDHVFATYSSNTSIPASPPATMPLPDTTESSSGTSITYNTTTDVITLQGGKTYELIATLGIVLAADTFDFTWYDNDAGAAVGISAISRGSSSSPSEGNPNATAVVTPPVDTDYIVRITAGSGTVNMNHSFVSVKEVLQGSGDHVYATYSTDTNTAAKIPLADSIDNESGSTITYNTTTDEVTLSTGTWRLEAHLAPSGSTARYQYYWQVVSGSQVGIRGFTAGSSSGSVSEGNFGATAIVTITASTSYQLTRTQFTADGIESERSFISIEKMDVESGGGGGISFPIRPSITTISSPSATQDLDLNTTGGHVFKITVDQDITLTFSNPPASGIQQSFEIEFENDSTVTERTVTLPSSVRQLSSITIPGTAPAARGLYVLRTNDGGSNYDIVQAISGTTGGGSGSQTPWTSDIDADGFDLKDLSNIEFRVTTAAPSASTPAIYADASGDLVHNVATGDSHMLDINGSSVFTVSASEAQLGGGVDLDINGNDIILDTAANTLIRDDAGTFEVDVSGATALSLDSNDFTLTTNIIMSGTGGSVDINGNDLILDADGDTKLRTPTDDNIHFDIGGTTDVITFGGVGTIGFEGTGIDHAIVPGATEFRLDTGASTDDIVFRFASSTEEMTWGRNHLIATSADLAWTVETTYDKASPTDTDTLAVYQWNFSNSASGIEIYAQMDVVADDVTDGTEDATINFRVIDAGSLRNVFEMQSDRHVTNSDIRFASGTRPDFTDDQTTVGSAGGADVLPSNPVGYVNVEVGGSAYVIPYYNN